jgi:glycosyltransferase involved in cell wall biosynthesis
LRELFKMSHTTIKVSIITPVYNSADVIGETISSVLKQNYLDWEMIIVDDGSTDNIQGVVNKFAQKDSRVKFFRQDNAGASAARNTAIRNTNYEWLLFLDADDWVSEDFFEKMIPVLENDTSIDVVHCGWTRVKKDGTTSKEVFGGEQADMFPSLAYYSPFAIHSCIVRKKLVEQVGGFDTSFKTCVDWDLWQRVARTGARFSMVKETMAFYRTRPNSLSSNVNQFCLNGLQVISNAYTTDDRVQHPTPEYANGILTDDITIRKYCFITWCAGILIGQGKEATNLLENMNGLRAENLDGDLIGAILIDSLIIPAEKDQCDWYQHWHRTEHQLKNFLSVLEEQTHSLVSASKASGVIELHVISESKTRITCEQIGTCLAMQVDVESFIQDVQLSEDVKRFVGIVRLKEKILGLVELVIDEGLLSSWVIKDAIATKFSWQILYHFFSLNVYPVYRETSKIKITEEIHDKIGWEFFLRELWNKPKWTENMFYVQDGKKEKGREVDVNDRLHIELSEDLPIVKLKTPVLKIDYYVGGIRAGTASCNMNGRFIYPQMIRAAINQTSGYEICRLVVREALIGQNLDNGLSLPERLKNAKRNRAQNFATL